MDLVGTQIPTMDRARSATMMQDRLLSEKEINKVKDRFQEDI